MTATYVLGINAYHGDVSAALVRDGQLVAAVEEERFRRVKHWAGFPTLAIRSVLDIAGIGGADVRHVAVSRDPKSSGSSAPNATWTPAASSVRSGTSCWRS